MSTTTTSGTPRNTTSTSNPFARGAIANGKRVEHWTPDPERLEQPLRWRKPRRVFVNSMSDLFHEDVPDEFRDKVFAVAALAPHHTFQILTKRPAEMLRYLTDETLVHRHGATCAGTVEAIATAIYDLRNDAPDVTWPLPNVHLLVSCEDQQRLDERVPDLLATPAAVRGVSLEPLLGPIDCGEFLPGYPREYVLPPGPGQDKSNCYRFLDWIVVGGESGPGARPCNVEWIRSIVAQCKSAGVPLWVKQLGSIVIDRNDAGFYGEEPHAWPDGAEPEDWGEYRQDYQGAPVRVHLEDRKGSDPSEWPEDLRVQELPRPF